MAKFKPSIISFEESYIPEPNSGCWLWTSTINNKGYGVLQAGGFRGYAHRFAYSTFVGAIPEGMSVCHRCDMPSCCNPDHLFLGTHQQNMADCRAKMRCACFTKPDSYLRGEELSISKLTEGTVREIRALRGLVSQRLLAKRFNVTRTTIRLAQTGATWAHVQ
jgi:hypothetical protein